MPVMMCASTFGCDRMISISSVPGGNPAAKADPEGYASEWTLCAACKSYTCDRCLGRNQGRCRCGSPARLFTDAERIQVANNLARGLPALPASATAAAAKPAPTSAPVTIRAAPATGAPTGGLPLRALLEGTMHQIDADLAQGNTARARAMAAVCASMMQTHGGNITAGEVEWLMQFGESFYRWRCFVEGALYFRALRTGALTRLGIVAPDPVPMKAIAIQSAYHLLGVDLAETDDEVNHIGAETVAKFFGPDHVLTRDVYARIGPPRPKPSAAPTPSKAPENVVVKVPQVSGPLAVLASLDASHRLALWVTLGFLDIGVADGKVADAEYLAWKQSMARMKLPDVWEKFGTGGLNDLLKNGALQQLSVEFAALPADARAKMAGVLIEFMMADGKAEAQEIQAIKRITGWLGVSLQFG